MSPVVVWHISVIFPDCQCEPVQTANVYLTETKKYIERVIYLHGWAELFI